MKTLKAPQRKAQQIIGICILILTLSGCKIPDLISTDGYVQTSGQEFSSGSSVSSVNSEEPAGIFEEVKRDRKESEETLYRFFEEAYEQYVQMGEVDLSDVLNMSSEECRRVVTELEDAIRQQRTAMDNGLMAKAPEKLPYQLRIIATSDNMGTGEDVKFACFLFDLEPTAGRSGLSEAEYVKRYPPFMTFGVNGYYMYQEKTNGRGGNWKIHRINYTIDGILDESQQYREPSLVSLSEFIAERYGKLAVQNYYDELWKQYIEMDYKGLTEVMEEKSPDILNAEAILKNCIESRKEYVGDRPESVAAQIPDYDIHITEVAVNPLGTNENEYGTIRFQLTPMEEREEGMSEEAYYGQYPEFMTFGENCFSFSLNATDEKAVNTYVAASKIVRTEVIPGRSD